MTMWGGYASADDELEALMALDESSREALDGPTEYLAVPARGPRLDAATENLRRMALDYSRRDPLIREVMGISWGDVGDFGKAAFPYIHSAGKGLAGAFGMGGAATALENLETKAGLLPPIPATPSSSATTSKAASTSATSTPSSTARSPFTPAPSQSWFAKHPYGVAAVAVVGVCGVGLLVRALLHRKGEVVP